MTAEGRSEIFSHMHTTAELTIWMSLNDDMMRWMEALNGPCQSTLAGQYQRPNLGSFRAAYQSEPKTNVEGRESVIRGFLACANGLRALAHEGTCHENKSR